MYKKESLADAFKGAWGLYSMTQYWEPEIIKSEGKLELQQGQNQVAAAVEAKLQFVVASVLGDTIKPSGGRLNARHFSIKAQIEEMWRKSGIPTAFVTVGERLPLTVLLSGFLS
jgi:hypothetical protein